MIKTSVLTFVLGVTMTSLSFAQVLPQPIEQAIEKYHPQVLLPHDVLDHAHLQQNDEGMGTLSNPEQGMVELICENTSTKVIDLQLVVNVPVAMQKGDTLLLVVKAKD